MLFVGCKVARWHGIRSQTRVSTKNALDDHYSLSFCQTLRFATYHLACSVINGSTWQLIYLSVDLCIPKTLIVELRRMGWFTLSVN